MQLLICYVSDHKRVKTIIAIVAIIHSALLTLPRLCCNLDSFLDTSEYDRNSIDGLCYWPDYHR